MKAQTPSQANKSKVVIDFLPGPVKIKDGLFMGDEIAAKDIQFIISNKVTHIINTVSKKIPNLWERFGIHYLSVNWTENQQNIFDKKNHTVNTVFHFIEEAMEQGQSCLIHSLHGKSRSCAVLTAYLMKKYQWSLEKCLEFIASKKQNLEIRNGYLGQLQELDKRMSQIYNLSSRWQNARTQQQLILMNTLANSQPAELTTEQNKKKATKKHVSWVQKPTVHKTGANKTVQKESKVKQSKGKLKSILKGDTKDKQEELKDFDEESFQDFQQSKPLKNDKGNFINHINGNVVHVTVNNFITSDKKKEHEKTPTNSRPFSSDQKQREKPKDKKIVNPKKILPYDTNYIQTFKSPYDTKLASHSNSNNKLNRHKKEEKQVKNALHYERPQSAKHRSGLNRGNLKEDFLVTNTNSMSMGGQKKKQTSTLRQQFFKRK